MAFKAKKPTNSRMLESKLCEIGERLFSIMIEVKRTRRHVMSAISDFAAKQEEFNDRLSTALDGIAGDITELNDLITKLQNTPGVITPEDQALLDAAQVKGEALAKKAEDLDALTPPAPPAEA